MDIARTIDRAIAAQAKQAATSEVRAHMVGLALAGELGFPLGQKSASFVEVFIGLTRELVLQAARKAAEDADLRITIPDNVQISLTPEIEDRILREAASLCVQRVQTLELAAKRKRENSVQ